MQGMLTMDDILGFTSAAGTNSDEQIVGPNRAQRRQQERARVAMKRRATRAQYVPRKADPEQQEFVMTQMTRALMGHIGTPAMRRNLTRRIIGDVRTMVEAEVAQDPNFAISPKADPGSQRSLLVQRKLAREIERRMDAKLEEIGVDITLAA